MAKQWDYVKFTTFSTLLVKLIVKSDYKADMSQIMLIIEYKPIAETITKLSQSTQLSTPRSAKANYIGITLPAHNI